MQKQKKARIAAAVSHKRAAVGISLFNQILARENIIRLALGIAFIVVLFNFAFLLAKNKTTTNVSSTQTQIAEEMSGSGDSLKAHIVAQGDNLWTIAERYYKSGYNWVDIAKANNLHAPYTLTAGKKLTIPDVKAKTVTVETKTLNRSTSTIVSKSISGSQYVVEKGDNLWSVAVRAYGDGFRWFEIAKANNLSNPDLIHTGNKLKIPR